MNGSGGALLNTNAPCAFYSGTLDCFIKVMYLKFIKWNKYWLFRDDLNLASGGSRAI